MKRSLLIIFYGLLLIFAIIMSLFFTPLLRQGFFIWIGAFFALGLALVVMTLKQKVAGRLKTFLLLTGGSASGFVASVLLHNLIYGIFIVLFGQDFWTNIGLGDEPVFFFIAILVCPTAFLIGTIGTIIMLIKGRNKSPRLT